MFAKLRSLFQKLVDTSPPEGSTTCAHCRKPITPGTPVSAAWMGAPHPYMHTTIKCDESGGTMYAGVWGKGVLIPFHALGKTSSS